MDNPAEILKAGLQEMDLHLPETALERLLAYVQLLERWNRRFSLTGVREPEEMVRKLLLDSLSLVHHLPAGEILLDVGSGAGLPGLPIAIACPERRVVLLDRGANQARFLRQAKAELEIEGAEVAEAEVERYHPAQLPDIITARAVKPPALLLQMFSHLCRAGTCLLFPRGRNPERELGELPPEIVVEYCLPLQVPGVDAERHLVVCRWAG